MAADHGLHIIYFILSLGGESPLLLRKGRNFLKMQTQGHIGIATRQATNTPVPNENTTSDGYDFTAFPECVNFMRMINLRFNDYRIHQLVDVIVGMYDSTYDVMATNEKDRFDASIVYFASVAMNNSNYDYIQWGRIEVSYHLGGFSIMDSLRMMYRKYKREGVTFRDYNVYLQCMLNPEIIKKKIESWEPSNDAQDFDRALALHNDDEDDREIELNNNWDAVSTHSEHEDHVRIFFGQPAQPPPVVPVVAPAVPNIVPIDHSIHQRNVNHQINNGILRPLRPPLRGAHTSQPNVQAPIVPQIQPPPILPPQIIPPPVLPPAGVPPQPIPPIVPAPVGAPVIVPPRLSGYLFSAVSSDNGFTTTGLLSRFFPFVNFFVPIDFGKMFVDPNPPLVSFDGNDNDIAVEMKMYPELHVCGDGVLTTLLNIEPAIYGSGLFDNTYFHHTGLYIPLPGAIIREAAVRWSSKERTDAHYNIMVDQVTRMVNQTTMSDQSKVLAPIHCTNLAMLNAYHSVHTHPVYNRKYAQQKLALTRKRYAVWSGIAGVCLLLPVISTVVSKIFGRKTMYSRGLSKADFNSVINTILTSGMTTNISSGWFAPIVEEILRTFFPYTFTTAIIAVEGVTNGLRSWGSAALHASMYAMQPTLSNLPWRILIHWYFNECFVPGFNYGFEVARQDFLLQQHLKNHYGCTDEITPAHTFSKQMFSSVFDGYYCYGPDKVLTDATPERGCLKRLFINDKHGSNRQCKFGIGDGVYRPVFYGSNAHNEEQSLCSRVLKQPPTGDINFKRKFCEFFKQNIKKLLPRTFANPIHSFPFEKYIRMSNALPGVKKQLRRTNEQLVNDGVTENSHFTRAEIKKFTLRKSFVKVENLNYRNGDRIKQRAPRMIQGAKAEFICIVGPYIAALQERMKRDLNANRNIVFTSSVSNLKCGNKLMEDYSAVRHILFEDDIGLFDASLEEMYMRLEVWFVKKLGCPLAVWLLMMGNINKRGVTPHGWYYRVLGNRASGDPFTSLFNTLLNIMFHLFIFCEVLKFTITAVIKRIRMLVQGDDNVERVPRSWRRINVQYYMGLLGFDAKAVYRNNPHEVEFCSMRLYRVGEGYAFVPKLGRVLSKIAYFIDPPVIDPMVLLRGTALGMMHTTVLPPFKTYFEHILNITSHVEAHPVGRAEWQMIFKPVTCTSETLSDLNLVYGWDEEKQRIFTSEVYKAKIKSDTVGPMYRFFCDVDTAAPQTYLH